MDLFKEITENLEDNIVAISLLIIMFGVIWSSGLFTHARKISKKIVNLKGQIRSKIDRKTQK